MPNMTLSLPEELHEKMMEHTEIRWSEVVRLAIQKRVADLELMEKLASRGKLTKKDAEEISEKIDREVSKKLGL